MDKYEEEQLGLMIKPLCEIVGESYLRAMILRVNVHLELAEQNGAEAEDRMEIVANALETATSITKEWLDKIGEVKRAGIITKGATP